MKKILFLVPVVLCIFIGTKAQLINPGRAAKTAAVNKTNSDIQSGASGAADQTEAGIKGLFKKKKKGDETPAAPAAATQATVPAQATGTTPGGNANAFSGGPAPSLTAYANYDFIPGSRIIFEDNFADDQDGEFPAHWDLGAGQAILNKMGDDEVLKLTDGNYAHVKPLMKNKTYLTDTFTIEFDLYPTTAAYPPHIYFYDRDGSSSDLGRITIDDGASFSSSGEDAKDLSASLSTAAHERWRNNWHHIAIACRNELVKIYVDQDRVLVVPHTGIVPRAFDVEGIGSSDDPIIFKNMRVANGGGMNQLGKKFTDAKLVTHGINFDTDKSTIKPESMGTLNMIVGILKENPEIKFEIDGHTDATGIVARNLTLSQQRAEAVKTALIGLGVDASRLTTKGFGSSKPISDNTSMEGKANNRRVEFIKQ